MDRDIVVRFLCYTALKVDLITRAVEQHDHAEKQCELEV